LSQTLPLLLAENATQANIYLDVLENDGSEQEG
jgi:hypothetical protein